MRFANPVSPAGAVFAGVLVALVSALVAACGEDAPDVPADGRIVEGDGGATATGPTFHKDVAPILQARCQKCHQPGGLAPFSLLTYAEARAMAPAVTAETAARRMPPWGALDTDECTPRLPWNHDERLTAAQIQTLADWEKAGTPEGDPKDAPAPVPLETGTLRAPTLTLAPRTPFVTAGTADQFRCFVLDAPALAQGAFINGIHVIPGNRKVVHHAVVFSDPGGKMAANAGPDGSFDCSSVAMTETTDMNGDGDRVNLDVWTPGVGPVELPANIAMPFVPGAKLVMQIHYSPGGTTNEPDSTRVELRVLPAGVKPEFMLFTTAVGNYPTGTAGEGLLPGPNDPASGVAFAIPPNVRDHVESMVTTIPAPEAGATPRELWIYGVMAHQHLAGTDVKVELQRGDDTQCLLQDRWDFHWQRMYTYASPVEDLPTIRPGDKIKLRCTYDNTMKNRRLAAEYRARGLQPMDIALGEETLDEMCLVIPQILVRTP